MKFPVPVSVVPTVLSSLRRAAIGGGRRHRLALLPLLCASCLPLQGLAAEAINRIDVAINGMVCSFCVQGIERKLGSLPATQSVKVDIQKHLVSISLRPGGTLSDEQLRKLIRDAGFDVRQIRRFSTAP